MSVPGRIGVILIVALALVDAFILASGARRAASAIQTHTLAEPASMQAEDQASEPLLSAALREINLIKARCTLGVARI